MSEQVPQPSAAEQDALRRIQEARSLIDAGFQRNDPDQRERGYQALTAAEADLEAAKQGRLRGEENLSAAERMRRGAHELVWGRSRPRH